MIRITDRVRLHEPEKVAGNVAEALAIADEYELDEATRAALLPTILTLLAAEHVTMEQTALGIGRLAPSIGERH